jgi:hypothetical protein
MKRFFNAIGVTLLLATGAVVAQQPSSNQPFPPQAAARPDPGTIEPNAIRDAGLRVVMAIDTGQTAKLWDESSTITKNSVTRNAFIAGIGNSRQPFGKIASRNWLSVRRQSADGTGLPPGLYASIEFLAEVSGKPPIRELVSFRLDEDGVWRFSGYAVQP